MGSIEIWLISIALCTVGVALYKIGEAVGVSRLAKLTAMYVMASNLEIQDLKDKLEEAKKNAGV